ncbi:hypothetical protein LA52FAK_21000 [Desulforhopalus sp. 52FAK]
MGVRWYEVQFAGVRIGHAKSERTIQKEDGKTIYKFSEEKELRLQILGTTNIFSTREIKKFSSIPPYPLLAYSYEDRLSDSSLWVHRLGAGNYSYSLQHGKNKKNQTLTGQYFNLSDELDLEMWVRTKPRKGESESFSCLTIDTPDVGVILAEVQDIRTSEKGRSVYDVMTTFQNDGFSHLNFDEAGKLLFMSGSSQLTYQLKNYKPLLPTQNSKDIYTSNIIPIDKTIGKIDTIQKLQLSISGPNVHLLESYPGQQVMCKTVEHCEVTLIETDLIDTSMESDIKEEINHKFTQLTSRMKSEEKRVKRIAEEVVEGILDPEKQIEKLAFFVDKYLDDAYVFDANLSQLLNSKRGDCTEHAFLFMTLARSLGIPCREVTGVIYIGDWCQGFGLHAWNEVYIDDRWLTVDASRGTIKTRPVYIRFPNDPYKTSLLAESTRDILITLNRVFHLK